ncbi:MAG: hypothetical protein KF724_00915 [Phycisphaeraceae bacterium]|nr:hypothetical protein [Phycisphaeraceae bacterium]
MPSISALPLIVLLLAGRPYDPLRLPEVVVHHHDLVVQDDHRRREIPLRVYLAEGAASAPVVLFSHGLGGSSRNNPYLGEHWARRGFAVVFMQHPGSDESVWRDVPAARRMAAMQRAASAANLTLRVHDVSAVIDQLDRWSREDGHALAGRLDLERIGMSGHSFGALTTQAVSGQAPALGRSAADHRIRAACAMSPSAPRLGGDRAAARAFSGVRIPWLVMTGTNDVSLIGGADLESRLAVFPALPPGSKYELVLFEAEHSAFGDRALPGDRGNRNPNHHRAILAITTAFWEATLRDDERARAWLDAEPPAPAAIASGELRDRGLSGTAGQGGPRTGSDAAVVGPWSVLEPNDRWQRK